jgi:hypothetical protein
MTTAAAPKAESSLLHAALSYARAGIPVFPLIPRDKKPLIPKEEGGSGYKDATTDETIIRAWWKACPRANIGIPTGPASGFWLLDVDGDKGRKTLNQLREKHPDDWPITRASRSGREEGGTHFLFLHRAGVQNNLKIERLDSGLEVKADGGYLVAPPSIHPTGRAYAWENEEPIVDAPAWLLEIVCNGRPGAHQREDRGAQNPNGHGYFSPPIPENARNTTLTSLAGTMHRRGMTRETILTALRSENEIRCQPPLPDSEVEKITNSITSYQNGGGLTVINGGPLSTAATPTHVSKRSVTMRELLEMELPVREALSDPPIFMQRSQGMIYGERGVGKSWMVHGLCLGLATGTPFMRFAFPKPRKVLLVDGEMLMTDIQDRLRLLRRSLNIAPSVNDDNLDVLAADFEAQGLSPLHTPEGQAQVEEHLDGVDIVFFDNISALFGGLEENDATAWNVAAEWLMGLKRRGIATTLTHHAGRSNKNPRGTSRREDPLDFVMGITRPDDYDPGSAENKFVVRFTKSRGVQGSGVEKFEGRIIKLSETDIRVESGEAIDDELRDLAYLLSEGKSIRAAAKEMHLSPSRVNRLRDKAIKAGLFRPANTSQEPTAPDPFSARVKQ